MGYRSIVVASLLSLAACSAPAPDEDVDRSEDGLSASASVVVALRLEDVDDGPRRLGVDPAGYASRSVTFFDTPDLDLYASGVVLRSQSGDVDATTATIAPLKPAKLAQGFAGSAGLACAYEKPANGLAVSSCSLAKEADEYRVGRAMRGVDAADEVFSTSQIAFVEKHAIAPDWSNVKPLGPIVAQSWKVQTAAVPSPEIRLERWNVPRGGRVLELSAKATGATARDVEAALVRWTATLGLRASATQTTPTAEALAALTR